MVKSADIKLGYSCNDACIHCVVSKLRDEAQKNKKVDLNTKEYLNEIIKSKQNQVNSITVTGGEPTIRPDFLEIIKFIKSQGLRVDLQTNGRKFSDINFFNQTKDHIDKYIIAIHGPNKNIHDKITQRENSFNQTVEGIKNIVKFKSNIIGKIVLSKINYIFLEEILDLFKELGVKFIIVSFPHSSGHIDYLKNIAPRYYQLKKYVQKVIEKYTNNNNFFITFENILPCSLDNEYHLKHFADFFERLNNTEIKMLNSRRYDWQKLLHSIRKKHNKCNLRLYNNWCYGYWNEYVDEYGFDEFSPITKITNKNILDILAIKQIKEMRDKI